MTGFRLFGYEIATPVKSKVITVNHHKTLKVLVPSTLVEGMKYTIMADTWCRISYGGGTLKNARTMQSPFKLTAKKPAE